MNDYSLTKDFINLNSTLNTIIVLVIINIILQLIKFISNIYFSNKDKNNKKQLLIEEKRIKVLETLFQKLDSMTLYDKSEEHKMLEDLKESNLFITQNKIYITKEVQKCSNKILDYFKDVLTDYRLKSIEKET